MSRTKQEKNKAFLLEGFDVLFNKRDFAGAEKYWSPNYIQHSSHIEPGRDGLFNLVKSLPTGSKWEHGIMMAEGDYVMIHSRYSNPDGSAIVVVDIIANRQNHPAKVFHERDANCEKFGRPCS